MPHRDGVSDSASEANEGVVSPEVLAVGRQGLREKVRRKRLEKDLGDLEKHLQTLLTHHVKL